MFYNKLSFKEQTHAKVNKAYTMLGIIKCNFKYLTSGYATWFTAGGAIREPQNR